MDDLFDLTTVSDGDPDPEELFGSVSSSDIYMYMEASPDVPFWDKPFRDYSVSEAFLLMIFVVALFSFLSRFLDLK